jgi:hypothetical protein
MKQPAANEGRSFHHPPQEVDMFLSKCQCRPTPPVNLPMQLPAVHRNFVGHQPMILVYFDPPSRHHYRDPLRGTHVPEPSVDTGILENLYCLYALAKKPIRHSSMRYNTFGLITSRADATRPVYLPPRASASC